MTNRKSVYEWALSYAGDPDSFQSRHTLILRFLEELGLTKDSHVLELGPGPLGLGGLLIPRLGDSAYCALEPNGWQVEAALKNFPDLEASHPTFLWRDDFMPEGHNEFDIIVAHSVLSHVSFGQMELCLANMRKVVSNNGFFLASLRLSDKNSYDQAWQYPGISTFRMKTLQVLGHHFGWAVEHMGEYKERMTKVAPNDIHDWVVFRPTATAAELNDMRLQEEQQQRDDRDWAQFDQEAFVQKKTLEWPE